MSDDLRKRLEKIGTSSPVTSLTEGITSAKTWILVSVPVVIAVILLIIKPVYIMRSEPTDEGECALVVSYKRLGLLTLGLFPLVYGLLWKKGYL